MSGEILYLHLGIPVLRFVHCNVGVIWPDLNKKQKNIYTSAQYFVLLLIAQCITYIFTFFVECIPSYLAPHNVITDVFGPFDEDIGGCTSLKGGVMFCLIA